MNMYTEPRCFSSNDLLFPSISTHFSPEVGVSILHDPGIFHPQYYLLILPMESTSKVTLTTKVFVINFNWPWWIWITNRVIPSWGNRKHGQHSSYLCIHAGITFHRSNINYMTPLMRTISNMRLLSPHNS